MVLDAGWNCICYTSGQLSEDIIKSIIEQTMKGERN